MSAIFSRAEIEALVFETFGIRRLMHDSPIRPDVWLNYFAKAQSSSAGDGRVSVILTPRRDADNDGKAPASAGEIAALLREWLGGGKGRKIAATTRYVVADLTFEELLRHVVVLTHWWKELKYKKEDFTARLEAISSKQPKGSEIMRDVRRVAMFRFVMLAGLLKLIQDSRVGQHVERAHIRRMAAALVRRPVGPAEIMDDIFGEEPASRGRTAGIFTDQPADVGFDAVRISDVLPICRAFLVAYGEDPEQPKTVREPIVWSIQRNRRVFPPSAGLSAPGTNRRHGLSRDIIKADAAIRLFDISTAGLTFAVVDTGIMAKHPALLEWDPGPRKRDYTSQVSRVKKTLDFTRLRRLMDDPSLIEPKQYDEKIQTDVENALRSLEAGIADVDWSVLEPLMWVNDRDMSPKDSHGTHVAAILAGHIPPLAEATKDYLEDWELPFDGVCPDLKLYDLRVFGDESESDEFAVLAALDYVSWINRDPLRPVIHGINLSLSLKSIVNISACGHTPVCEAANRLVAMGTVVVAAAGNAGFDPNANGESMGFGYRDISITDPANAEDVISVGATHWCEPHTYGVSYFSSRGPTGDGRMKPDLVAPGEKILSAVLNDRFDWKDGTSMAAPHVAGVCALLMARHRELIGRPDRIKHILMSTATDLRRERHFQGAGLVDALRALQSV